jgi:hypothetical protein
VKATGFEPGPFPENSRDATSYIEIRSFSEIGSYRFGTAEYAECAEYADKNYAAASVGVVSVIRG